MPTSARISRTLRHRASILVDVETVGIDTDREYFGAEFPQRLGRHAIGGAIGAVDHHAQSFQAHRLRQRALGEFNIAGMFALDALGAADVGAFRQAFGEIGIHQRFDLTLDLVGELVAVRSEQLDAVVVVGVVRGGDHHAEIAAHRARQHGNRRRRHRAGLEYVHADRGKAGNQGSFDHVAGKPGILADQHAVTMIAPAKHQPSRLPDPKRQFRRNEAIGAAAYAVRAKILTRHALNPARCSGDVQTRGPHT
jgi:hypothetical protein